MWMDLNGHPHFTNDSLYWIIHIWLQNYLIEPFIWYSLNSLMIHWWSLIWIIYIYSLIPNILLSTVVSYPTVFCWNTCWRVLSTVGVKSWRSLGSGLVTSISTIVSVSVASLGAHTDVCSEWKILVSFLKGRTHLKMWPLRLFTSNRWKMFISESPGWMFWNLLGYVYYHVNLTSALWSGDRRLHDGCLNFLTAFTETHR